jgi:hypothetical protein
MRLVVGHADKLKAFVEKSSKVPPALSPDDVVRRLATENDLEFRTMYSIFNAIDNLNALKSEFGTSDLAIENLITALGTDAVPGLEEARDKIRAALEVYSDDNPIAISLKAQRLGYLREKLFVDSEVITDARPVFDSKAEKVLEYVITNSLVLTFHEDEGNDARAQHKHHRLHITLDLDDLLKLKKACDRALLKARALKNELGDKGHILGGDDEF